MAAARHLHQRRGVPGPQQQALRGLAAPAQEPRQQAPAGQLAGHQEDLHGGNRVVQRHHAAGRQLPERRVEGGVALVVDALPNLVAQGRPALGLGPVAPGVGVAPVGLDTPLPDVAVDVVGQQGRARDQRQPPEQRQPEGGPQGRPPRPARPPQAQQEAGAGPAEGQQVGQRGGALVARQRPPGAGQGDRQGGQRQGDRAAQHGAMLARPAGRGPRHGRALVESRPNARPEPKVRCP